MYLFLNIFKINNLHKKHDLKLMNGILILFTFNSFKIKF